MSDQTIATPAAESYADLFKPKLITTLKEGYSTQKFAADVIAGLTVAIVAMPLAMGIAIASGSTPDKGLTTAVIAGFLISALGGSRFQIGGPTAAFIVVVYRVIETHGYDGMVLATLMAGLILTAIGYLRLGTYIKYIPYPVTIGFTAGIGITIFVSQVADLLGLTTGKLPGEFLEKVEALAHALPTTNMAALALSLASVAVILSLRRFAPKLPGFLIAVVAASVVVLVLKLDVVTIGSKFGGIPRALPMPELPTLSLAKIGAVFPSAVTIALLAGIESLLSAVVADGMTGRRHRSNCELVAQGYANIASALFAGLPATGAIARTATNIRSGATGPVSGMLHAVFVLAFMLVAAPLAAYIPLAVLAAILAIVAWNMAEVHVLGVLLKNSGWGDRAVLLATLLLTVFYDLTVGIEVGVVLAAILFMHHMAEAVGIEGRHHGTLIEEDRADDPNEAAYDPASQASRDVVVYHISGPFFFGAASQLTTTLARIGTRPRRLILDFAQVPLIDSTGAAALKGVVREATMRGEEVVFAALSPRLEAQLERFGAGHEPSVPTIAEAAALPSPSGRILR
jgi:sulfate permease, SulP family